jgi:opacity protein-like surface antigen
MRFRALFSPVCTVAISVLCGGAVHAQVAPAAKVGGLPIAISVGFSDYDLDYGPGRRMQGLVIRGGYDLFHGLGIDVDARTIFMNTPPQLQRMQQTTYLVGAYYVVPRPWRVRPFVRYAGGIGDIEFPSSNPLYTRDSYTVYAPSGGVEIPVMHRLSIRGEYEYQFWHQYHGPHDLTPQGFTIGVTYHMRGIHTRPHSVN